MAVHYAVCLHQEDKDRTTRTQKGKAFMSSISLSAGIVARSADFAQKDLKEKILSGQDSFLRTFIDGDLSTTEIELAREELQRAYAKLHALEVLKDMAEHVGDDATMEVTSSDYKLLRANLPPR